MEYYTAMKMTDLQPYATIWLNCTSMMLREKQDTKG